MAYLYGESPPERKTDLQAHLHVCPACKATVQDWQATLGQLDKWEIPALSVAARETSAAWPALKWAAAALLVLGVGFGVGRFRAPPPATVEQMRAALLPRLRQELQQQFSADLEAALAGQPAALTNDFRRRLRHGLDRFAAETLAISRAEAQLFLDEFTQSYAANREQDRQTTLALYQRAERLRRADSASLRRDLETVAVVAEDRFRRADDEIGWLASNARPTPAFNQSTGEPQLIPTANPKDR